MTRTRKPNERFGSVNRLLIQMTVIVFLLSVSLVALGIFHVHTLQSLDRAYSKLLENDLSRLQLIQHVTAQTFSVNRNCLTLLVSSPGRNPTELVGKIRRSLEQQQAAMRRLKSLEWPERGLFDSLELGVDSFNVTVERFLGILSGQGQGSANDFRVAELRPQMDHLNEVFGALALSTYNEALSTGDKSSAAAARSSLIGSLLAGWPFLIVLAGSLWATVRLVRFFFRARSEDELPV